jgi:hypothetical protein
LKTINKKRTKFTFEYDNCPKIIARIIKGVTSVGPIYDSKVYVAGYYWDEVTNAICYWVDGTKVDLPIPLASGIAVVSQ